MNSSTSLLPARLLCFLVRHYSESPSLPFHHISGTLIEFIKKYCFLIVCQCTILYLNFFSASCFGWHVFTRPHITFFASLCMCVWISVISSHIPCIHLFWNLRQSGGMTKLYSIDVNYVQVLELHICYRFSPSFITEWKYVVKKSVSRSTFKCVSITLQWVFISNVYNFNSDQPEGYYTKKLTALRILIVSSLWTRYMTLFSKGDCVF